MSLQHYLLQLKTKNTQMPIDSKRNRLWYISTTEYYIAMKMTELRDTQWVGK